MTGEKQYFIIDNMMRGSNRGAGILVIGLVWLLLIIGACAPKQAPAPAEGQKPAEFVVSDLRLPNLAESVYDKVDIRVTVTNIGDQEGTYAAALKVDDSIAETQNVTLAGGVSQHVFFTIPVTSPLGHNITIDNLTAKLEMPAN